VVKMFSFNMFLNVSSLRAGIIKFFFGFIFHNVTFSFTLNMHLKLLSQFLCEYSSALCKYF
jgi:hypothetical protein